MYSMVAESQENTRDEQRNESARDGSKERAYFWRIPTSDSVEKKNSSRETKRDSLMEKQRTTEWSHLSADSQKLWTWPVLSRGQHLPPRPLRREHYWTRRHGVQRRDAAIIQIIFSLVNAAA